MQRFKDCTKYRYAMNAIPETFRHPKHIHNTYRQAGGNKHTKLKIILILRKPGSRGYFLYKYVLHGYLKKPSSDEWYSPIESQITCMPMSFDCYVGIVLESNLDQINDLPISLYSHTLVEWIKYVTRDQILIASYNEVRETPE